MRPEDLPATELGDETRLELPEAPASPAARRWDEALTRLQQFVEGPAAGE